MSVLQEQRLVKGCDILENFAAIDQAKAVACEVRWQMRADESFEGERWCGERGGYG